MAAICHYLPSFLLRSLRRVFATFGPDRGSAPEAPPTGPNRTPLEKCIGVFLRPRFPAGPAFSHAMRSDGVRADRVVRQERPLLPLGIMSLPHVRACRPIPHPPAVR